MGSVECECPRSRRRYSWIRVYLPWNSKDFSSVGNIQHRYISDGQFLKEIPCIPLFVSMLSFCCSLVRKARRFLPFSTVYYVSGRATSPTGFYCCLNIGLVVVLEGLELLRGKRFRVFGPSGVRDNGDRRKGRQREKHSESGKDQHFDEDGYSKLPEINVVLLGATNSLGQ